MLRLSPKSGVVAAMCSLGGLFLGGCEVLDTKRGLGDGTDGGPWPSHSPGGPCTALRSPRAVFLVLGFMSFGEVRLRVRRREHYEPKGEGGGVNPL